MSTKVLIFLLIVTVVSSLPSSSSLPIVINTWSESFSKAGKLAYDTLVNSSSVLDAVVAGCRLCQEEQCDHSVGWGGSPDESGDTTLDGTLLCSLFVFGFFFFFPLNGVPSMVCPQR